jgi:hypothetical protein
MNDFTLYSLALERGAELLRDAERRRLAETARRATRDRAQAVRSRPAATRLDTPPARRTSRDTEPCAAC